MVDGQYEQQSIETVQTSHKSGTELKYCVNLAAVRRSRSLHHQDHVHDCTLLINIKMIFASEVKSFSLCVHEKITEYVTFNVNHRLSCAGQ